MRRRSFPPLKFIKSGHSVFRNVYDHSGPIGELLSNLLRVKLAQIKPFFATNFTLWFDVNDGNLISLPAPELLRNNDSIISNLYFFLISTR